MKLNLIRTSLGIILLATLVGMAPAAQAHNRSCSQAGVAGTYGYTYTGTIFLPTGAAIPAAAVGRATLDAEGNFSAQQTRSVGGGVGEETLKGTYSVNADCTFTLKADVYDGSGNLARSAVLAGVFDAEEGCGTGRRRSGGFAPGAVLKVFELHTVKGDSPCKE